MRRWRPSSSGASTFSTTCCRRASPTSERSRRSSSSITSIPKRRRSASARRWACPSTEPRRPSRPEVRRLGNAFDKLETRGTLTKTKRFRPGDQAGKANHLVKLPKGAKPVSVSLSPKEQVAWRMFGKFVQARGRHDPELEDNLLKAHIKLRPEEYLAVAWMNTTFAAVGSVVAAFALAIFLFILRIDIFSLLIFLGLVAALPIFFSYMYYFGLPVGYKGKPRSRGKKMETLGMLAESFVTVVVAFPLFLVVIMAIMALISKGSSGSVLVLLYVVVALMIPLSQFGFIFVIWNMEQEA